MSFAYANGYIGVSVNGRIRHEHDLIAERTLGRALPKGVIVHHINEIRADNRNENLVICLNRRYHALLHLRIKALEECGNASWRRCVYCKIWDDPLNMVNHGKQTFKHRICNTKYNRSRRESNEA